MVSTRRSRSGAASDSEHQNDEQVPSSQEDAASQPTPRKVRSSLSLGTHARLQPIEEEQVAAVAAVAKHASQEAVHQLQQHPQDIQQQQQEQQGQQDVVLSPRVRRQPRTARLSVSMPPAEAAAEAAAEAEAEAELKGAADTAGAIQHERVCDQHGNEGGDDEWDFDGPDVLQQLAASLRSAMDSRAGLKQHQHRQDSSAVATAAKAGAIVRRAAVAAAVDGDDGDDDSDVKGLRWRPSTGLQLPAKAAHITTLHVRRQGGSSEAAGPLVQLPSSAQPSGITTAAVLPPPAAAAATAAASSEAGLAKHGRAPPLDPVAAAKEARKAAPKTAGKGWFDLPEGKIDASLKRDLRLLRLRGAYDPKRFYKSFDNTKFPKHFAVGTVLDDPLDFYGGRLSQGQRKASMTDQLLADRELEVSRKKRYNKLQDEAQKWVKHKKRKTGLPRKTPAKHRPKH